MGGGAELPDGRRHARWRSSLPFRRVVASTLIGLLLLLLFAQLAYLHSFTARIKSLEEELAVLRREHAGPPHAGPTARTHDASLGSLVRRVLFPHPAFANPARHVWLSQRADWHSLVRAPGALPRGGEELASVLRRLRRNAAKAELISLLQGYAGVHGDAEAAGRAAEPPEPPLPRSPTANHGPLAVLASCKVLRDRCMVHLSVRACVQDELCGWCPGGMRGGPAGLCVDRFVAHLPDLEAGEPAAVCAGGVLAVVAESLPSRFWAAEGASRDVLELILPGADSHGPPTVRRVRHGPSHPRNSSCSVVVTRRRPLLVSLLGNSVMGYHFWTETAPGWFAAANHHGGLVGLQQHVWVHGEGGYLDLAALFSPSCPRSPSELPAGVTVCYARDDPPAHQEDPHLVLIRHATGAEVPPSQGAGGGVPVLEPLPVAVARGLRVGLAAQSELIAGAGGEGAAALAQGWTRQGTSSFLQFMLYQLGLWDVRARHEEVRGGRLCRPLVLLISRKEKRFIINEAEVVAGLQALRAASVWPSAEPRIGCSALAGSASELEARADGPRAVDVEVATLEDMPLFEQMAALRRASVLIGVHGSALINAMHMHAGTALVQIVPQGVSTGASFFAPACAAAGVSYLEMTVGERNDTQDLIQHFHFLDKSFKERRREIQRGVLGAECCSASHFFTFFINRDMAVPIASLQEVVSKALKRYGREGEASAPSSPLKP